MPQLSCRLCYLIALVLDALALQAQGLSTRGSSSLAKQTPDTFDYVIDLDLPPRQRLKNAFGLHMTQQSNCDEELRNIGGADVAKDWVANANIEEDYMEELRGAVEAFGGNLDCLVLKNLMYDIDGAHHGTGKQSYRMCSGILAALPNGTVLHGRNVDFEHPWGLANIAIYKVLFMRNGKPFMVSSPIGYTTGIHTGMRFDGYTVEQNTRPWGMSTELDLLAAKRGGKPSFMYARKIMEEVPDFSTAVSRFASTAWQAPQYWLLAGNGAFEGAVVTVDSAPETGKQPVANVELLNRFNRWYLLQTNEDRWTVGTAVVTDPEDKRFENATASMALVHQADFDMAAMNKVMQTPPVLDNVGNIFYWTAIPQQNYWHVQAHPEPPLP